MVEFDKQNQIFYALRKYVENQQDCDFTQDDNKAHRIITHPVTTDIRNGYYLIPRYVLESKQITKNVRLAMHLAITKTVGSYKLFYRHIPDAYIEIELTWDKDDNTIGDVDITMFGPTKKCEYMGSIELQIVCEKTMEELVDKVKKNDASGMHDETKLKILGNLYDLIDNPVTNPEKNLPIVRSIFPDFADTEPVISLDNEPRITKHESLKKHRSKIIEFLESTNSTLMDACRRFNDNGVRRSLPVEFMPSRIRSVGSSSTTINDPDFDLSSLTFM